ncbi:hypothetical protein FPQ18DRAFT_301624 [Pyronema domesticum]|nr:hypothetical protein FPQ18DRAFT_301624 [Pyronema domesticum]
MVQPPWAAQQVMPAVAAPAAQLPAPVPAAPQPPAPQPLPAVAMPPPPQPSAAAIPLTPDSLALPARRRLFPPARVPSRAQKTPTSICSAHLALRAEMYGTGRGWMAARARSCSAFPLRSEIDQSGQRSVWPLRNCGKPQPSARRRTAKELVRHDHCGDDAILERSVSDSSIIGLLCSSGCAGDVDRDIVELWSGGCRTGDAKNESKGDALGATWLERSDSRCGGFIAVTVNGT